MEASISGDQLECIVCTEIPIKVYETDCGGAIVGETGGPKLKTCPNRCLKEGVTLVLNANKFIQRMVSHLPASCPYCKSEFTRAELVAHMEEGDANNMQHLVINKALHPCCLYRTKKKNNWLCDGRRIIKYACAGSGKARKSISQQESWYCFKGDFDFCPQCIQAYGNNFDELDMKAFNKDGDLHLTHVHKLKMCMGSEVNQDNRKNGYGHFKNGGCTTDGDPNERYLICSSCKIGLGEKCFLSDPNDFIEKVSKDIHPHKLRLQAWGSGQWKCDIHKEGCSKSGVLSNLGNKFSYRCDPCDFDIGIQCLRN